MKIFSSGVDYRIKIMGPKIKQIICKSCQNNITKKHYGMLCAGKCKQWFHKICTNLSEGDYKHFSEGKGKGKWLCEDCFGKDDIDSSDYDSVEEDKDKLLQGKKLRRSGSLKSILMEENPTNKDLLVLMNKKFEGIEQSLNFSGDMIEKLRDNFNEIKNETKKLKQDNIELRKEMDDLRKELAAIKIDKAKENLQVRNKNIVMLNTSAGKNVNDEVVNIITKLEITISREDFTTKILPTKNPTKPVLVAFKTEEMQKAVLEKRKELETSTDYNIPGPRRQIYINEDVPKELRVLLGKSKVLKTKGYKYVWLKYGKVFCRKTDDGPIIRITSENKISELTAM